MKIAIIVAAAKDRAIGQNNQLLWRLPADLKRFKALTTGHSIIMGRKTYESLPNGALPNRRNIVISRNLEAKEGIEVATSLEEALHLCLDEERVFIIGGGQVYRTALPLADELYITEVEASYTDADVHFPEWNKLDWERLYEEYIPADDRNELNSCYSEWRRVRNFKQ